RGGVPAQERISRAPARPRSRRLARTRLPHRAREEKREMIFHPFYRFETGCAAYVLGCGGMGRCAVVDPQLDRVESYAAFAESKNMRITHVIDTHLHADHRSGARALAALSGAEYCLHESAGVAYAFTALRDRQDIEVGNVHLEVLHTPGHTPESI